MTEWIVTHVPAGLVLVIFIVGIAGGSMLLQSVVRKRFPALTRDEHNDVTRFTYGVIGFVYAFFMGFVVSTMWGQINTADGKARTEGAAAVQMANDLRVFDQPDADRIRAALLTYEQAALAEWEVQQRGASARADTALADLYVAYEQVQPGTDVQTRFLNTSFTNLDKVSQARTERLLQARTDTGPPWPLWAVIFITSAMVLGTAIIYGVEKATMHYPMTAVIGALVATNLFLVVQLSHPFLGDLSTSSEPLREVIAVLQ
ncbi:hypothetical protein BVC93_01490 [Mycobacterium sp. MS1601]|uniref:bestrophin-like domain n=1 Tax=Mycobacterium sp. MS1601 TaxID=1936029 RepID=UPI000979181C|nr:DUF4239 domain-containing protein [Mycobacterium sp. MS1601]AQA01319.1 hypothetical protein BVC93_01490 [Mycobacterium sp. MS1601]